MVTREMQETDPVPAVRESEAAGQTAVLFEDIRRTLGTTSVNLIWRHLATLPGALAWCWDAVAPLHQSADLDELARGLRRSVPVPPSVPLTSDVLQVFALSADDRSRIHAALRGYWRSCTMNVLSLNTLLMAMTGAGSEAAAPSPTGKGAARQDPPMEKMPKALGAPEMSPHVADLAWSLNALGERGDGRILASLYRYLANWPSALGIAWVLLQPEAASGRLDAAITQCLAEADERARNLIPRLNLGARELDEDIRQQITLALQDFARNAIPKVIPITGLLLGAFASPGLPALEEI